MDKQKVVNLIQAGPWALDLDFGMKVYSNYLRDLDLIRSGVDVKVIIQQYRTDAHFPRYMTNTGKPIQSAEGIAHLYFSGVMMEEGGFCTRGVRELVEDLEQINQNGSIQGVLLELNSGGGTASSAHMLHNALSNMNKPVVTFGHTVASGAYMAASATSEIIAAGSGAEFGSIGVLISFRNEDLQDMRENYTSIYSNLSNKKNGEIRSLLAGDNEPLKAKLDELAENFIGMVKATRKIDNKDVFEGGMYLAKDAKKAGLIDQIGTRETAMNILNRHIKHFRK
jgi:protease-4